MEIVFHVLLEYAAEIEVLLSDNILIYNTFLCIAGIYVLFVINIVSCISRSGFITSKRIKTKYMVPRGYIIMTYVVLLANSNCLFFRFFFGDCHLSSSVTSQSEFETIVYSCLLPIKVRTRKGMASNAREDVKLRAIGGRRAHRCNL